MIYDLIQSSSDKSALDNFASNDPVQEPVSLERVKAFLRIDHDDEDETLKAFIIAAREHVENYLSASLIKRNRLYVLNLENHKYSPEYYVINHATISQIHAINAEYSDETIRLKPEDYIVNIYARPAKLHLLIPRRRQLQALKIILEAGYSAEPDNIPMPIRQAMMLIIARNYEHRGDEDGAMQPIPLMAQALLMPYQEVRL